jgi:hypothetical protein
LLVDDPATVRHDRQASPAAGPSISRGYEQGGEPILGDDEADEPFDVCC